MAALNTDSKTCQPVVVIDRFSYAYPGAEDFTLRDVSLRIEPGECHLFEGPTGSGKTTLLMAIRGLLPPGRQSGTVQLSSSAGNLYPGAPGLIQQNPKAQLLCANLGADVAFGLGNHCVDPVEMPLRVEEALTTVGLHRPLHLPVDSLSMGQQYRACIAGQLVMEPLLLMLDEPVAQLDVRGREKTLEVIRRLKRSGRAVLICEHCTEILQSVVDRRWRLDTAGRLAETRRPLPPAADACRRVGIRRQSRGEGLESVQSPPVIRVHGTKFGDRHGELDLSGCEFSVAKGECITICGPNGSGKTTLIRAIAGLVRPLAGEVEVFGAVSGLRHLRGRLAVLFQDPGKQLFETTVFDEVVFAARRSLLAEELVAERVTMLLEELDLHHLAQASPHGLSYGQKHLVGLAAVLAGRPEVLLLDDPFAGLDRDRAVQVRRLVAKVSAEYGTTVLWTTHDPGSLHGWADRVIDITATQVRGIQAPP